jgi:creatinine amidohydrolase
MSFYFGEKTWVELEEYIQKNAVVIVPVGTTEEHGRHLPVETDAMIAKYFGDCLGKACEGVVPALVTQPIYFGFSMAIVRRWPGCININTRTFISYMFDAVNSLVEMGFKKIVLLDCHGNHDSLLRTVMREIVDKHNVYTMTLSPTKLSSKRYDEIKKDPEGDIHGGEWETSAVMHIRPDLVNHDEFTNVDAIRCNSPLRGPISTWGLQETKTGLFGDPTYATPELGEEIFKAATEEGLKLIKEYYKL